jgi:hypothetical protein
MARSGSRLPRRVPELSTLNSQAGETVKIFWLRDLSRKTLTSCKDAGGTTPPRMGGDCTDAGGRATQGAVAEIESRLEQRSRAPTVGALGDDAGGSCRRLQGCRR